ncbi:MAG TPA: hypothetical protein VHX20_15480 [Terracidiphilus sp.]|nr:hypothetical protein [Terracidiphilus sp.]
MEPRSAAMAASQSATKTGTGSRSLGAVLKSYFYWTYSRGSFHYDVMVTLILAFIFIAPHLWNFGDRPSPIPSQMHPILVTGDGGHGVIITVEASDADVPAGAPDKVVKRALRHAIEPVTGDDISIVRWETVRNADGNLAWKVWAHK